jgi:hypothetical protein
MTEPGTRYFVKRYAPRSWAICTRVDGRPVAYPGPTLALVAASWLRWESGADGDTAVSLNEFTEIIAAAERRIVEALKQQGENDGRS